jgi:hypothetical protein
MGTQPEQDDEWELPGEDVLKELSPLQEIRQRGLFQRIACQRAAYFADVEAIQHGIEDDEIEMDDPGTRSAGDKAAGQPEDRSPPSGFADLSTWCCDAYLPARARSVKLPDAPPRLISIADQPTVALSLLSPRQSHIADMPTQPNLSTLSASVPDKLRTPGKASATLWRRLWNALLRLCGRLLRAWPACSPQKMCSPNRRLPGARSHELLMQRLREHGQQGISSRVASIPPGGTSSHQVRLPADRLFR